MPAAAAPTPTLHVRLCDFRLSGLVALAADEALRLHVRPPPPAQPQRSPPAAADSPCLRRAAWPPAWQPSFDLPVPAPPHAAPAASPLPPVGLQPPNGAPSRPRASRPSRGPRFRRRRPTAAAPAAVAAAGDADPPAPPAAAAAAAFTLVLVAAPQRARQPHGLLPRRWPQRHCSSGGGGGDGGAERELGRVTLPVHTVATGPVQHSLVLATHDGPRSHPLAQSPLCLSFEAHATHAGAVRLRLTDLSATWSGRPVGAPYVVVSFEPARAPAVVAGTPPAPPPAPAAAAEGEGGAIVTSRVCARGTNCAAWDALPPLLLPACTVAALAHGTLTLRLHDASADNALVASHMIPYHTLWATNRFTTDLQAPGGGRCAAALSATVSCLGVPTTAQMLGGVHTEFGIFGARPVVFGVPLPAIDAPISSGVAVPSPPPAAAEPGGRCLELVDSFGWTYWHDMRAAACGAADPDSRIKPDAFGVVHDLDVKLAAPCNVERVSRSRSRSRADGAELWAHPRACHVSGQPFGPPASRPAAPGAGSEGRAGQAAGGRKAERRLRSSVGDLLGDDTSSRRLLVSAGGRAALCLRASDEDDEGLALTDDAGCATDMRWTRLDSALADGPRAVCPGTEGHTLTRHGDCVLRFGGATDDGGKLNAVFSLNPATLQWSERPAVGALPEGRVGHGAVSIGGPGMPRMLAFGGTSRRGRLNDMHCFDVERNAWSPVAASGARPSPRARLGMALLHDSALVFGGREGYSYLCDRYFDEVCCFNATRSEWVAVAPRGTGPSPRCGSAVQVLNERLLFVHGGFDERKYFGETWLLDTVSCSWQRPPYADGGLAPSGRESHASAAVGDCVLVYGGESVGAYCADLHLFDGARLRWCGTPEASGHSPGARCGAAMAALDGRRVLVVGGLSGFCAASDAFVLDTQLVSRRDVDAIRAVGVARGADAAACVVCLDEAPTQMFAFCGHTVVCLRCARRGMSVCPVCRAPVSKTVSLLR